ncbi:MAG: zf-HC2 domain-containing protein [Candidatus Aminicenantes bacterium]|nr:zf-HC2 domain-containing protein [Candidatus Aminicenantes bacterium]
MNCRKAKSHLPLLAGGELGGRKTRALRSHLDLCPACRAEAADFRAALDRARSSAAEGAALDWTESEWRRMMDGIIASPPAANTVRRAFSLKPALSAAAAFCLVVLGTQYAFRQLLRTPRLSAPGARREAAAVRPDSLPAFDRASLAALADVAGLRDPAFPDLSSGKQDIPALTIVSPESGVKIVWFFNENLDMEE